MFTYFHIFSHPELGTLVPIYNPLLSSPDYSVSARETEAVSSSPSFFSSIPDISPLSLPITALVSWPLFIFFPSLKNYLSSVPSDSSSLSLGNFVTKLKHRLVTPDTHNNFVLPQNRFSLNDQPRLLYQLVLVPRPDWPPLGGPPQLGALPCIGQMIPTRDPRWEPCDHL